MMSKSIYIYGLTDPRTGAICYVGQAQDVQKRYKAHFANDTVNSAKQAWFADLAAQGLQPGLVILDSITIFDNPDVREGWWIGFGTRCGWPLLNQQKSRLLFELPEIPSEPQTMTLRFAAALVFMFPLMFLFSAFLFVGGYVAAICQRLEHYLSARRIERSPAHFLDLIDARFPDVSNETGVIVVDGRSDYEGDI